MGLLFHPTTPGLVRCNDFEDASKAAAPGIDGASVRERWNGKAVRRLKKIRRALADNHAGRHGVAGGEALLIAAIRQSLAVERAVLSALADQRAGKPPRNRRIRIVHDHDGGVAAVEDDMEAPAPAAEGVEEQTATPEQAAPAGTFSNVW